jgi:hypothetical protein
MRLAAVAAGLASLGSAVPALASGAHARHPLALTVRTDSSAFMKHAATQATVTSPSATQAYAGFSCEVTVGVGADGQTAQNFRTADSSEFYFAYKQRPHHSLYSVTTNCVGTLPAGTVHANAIVSHPVACKQFDPFNQSAPAIQGYGMSTTYPDGQYSETCNTPKFRH